MSYAKGTQTSIPASVAEIERTLDRYGADAFAYAKDRERAVLQFDMAGVRIRLSIPLPSTQDKRFTMTPTGRDRSYTAAMNEWESEVRRRWRVLVLLVKAKLEAVDSGVSELRTEFAAHIVLPDGSTVGEWLMPQIDAVYESGAMPPMLEAGP